MKHHILIVCTIIIFVSCSKDKFDSPGVIKGNVYLTTDYHSYPLSGFDDHSGTAVTLYDQFNFKNTVKTDSDGNYEFRNVKEGQYHLLFEKEGFTYYELFDIQHNGTDTLNFTYAPTKSKAIRLEQIKKVDFRIVKPPYISSYKGTIDYGPNKSKFGENFDIVLEVKNQPDFGCIALINDSKPVDEFNYRHFVFPDLLRRSGIENPVFKINFSEIDRKIFTPGTTIYIRYYPCGSGLVIYDPWMEMERFFMIYSHQSIYTEFTLPTESYYYEGREL